MELIIDGYVISEPIINILYQAKRESDTFKLNHIINKGSEVLITCPVHKNGQETHPSCFVNARSDVDIEYGFYHCFTCGSAGPLWKLIAEIFEADTDFGKQWLVSRFGALSSYRSRLLDAFDFGITEPEAVRPSVDESILHTFKNWHPYLEARKLTPEVCNRFEVKYDPESNCVVFPVRDEFGRLSFLTRRDVDTKSFVIDKNADKSNVYLLNEVIARGCKTVVVVESQINALTLWKYGYPAVALFGAGTSTAQLEKLNRTSIRNYILAYDNDQAGRRGAQKFKKGIRKDVLVEDILMPEGRDVNDLTDEEIIKTFGGYFN